MRFSGADASDQQLVDRVRAGDKNAFNFLVLRYQNRVAALVARFIKDHQEVEDVTQEAFIKAYRALHLFRGDSAFYTWLYRIAVNTAKNTLVARGRRPPASDLDVGEAALVDIGMPLRDHETPEGSLATAEFKEAVENAIEWLADDLRTSFTLR